MAPTSSGTTLSRVAVWYHGTQKDLALPAQDPIFEYIDTVVDALGDETQIEAPSGSQWTLAKPTGPLRPEQSLQGAKVTDGAALELRTVHSTERYREVVEDVIDAAAESAAAAGRPFDESAARTAGLTGLTVAGIALCVAQWALWAASGYSPWWLLAGLIGATVALTGTWSATRRYHARDAATAWTVLSIASATVIGQAIPVSQRTHIPGLSHVMVSAIAVAAAAICTLVITRRHLTAITAVITIAAQTAVVCAIGDYTRLQPSAIAAAALIVGLIGMQIAPTVAASLARIALPKVPAEGESIEIGGEISVTELHTVHIRARRAVDMTTGLIVAFAAIIAAATVWTMNPHSYHWKVELIIVGCVAIVLTTWGRTLSNSVQAYAQFTAAVIVVLGASTRMLLAWPTGWAPIAVMTTVAAVTVALVVAAVVVAPRGVSPLVNGTVEIIGLLALVAAYPLSAWVTGIFGLLRDLKIG